MNRTQYKVFSLLHIQVFLGMILTYTDPLLFFRNCPRSFTVCIWYRYDSRSPLGWWPVRQALSNDGSHVRAWSTSFGKYYVHQPLTYVTGCFQDSLNFGAKPPNQELDWSICWSVDWKCSRHRWKRKQSIDIADISPNEGLCFNCCCFPIYLGDLRPKDEYTCDQVQTTIPSHNIYIYILFKKYVVFCRSLDKRVREIWTLDHLTSLSTDRAMWQKRVARRFSPQPDWTLNRLGSIQLGGRIIFLDTHVLIFSLFILLIASTNDWINGWVILIAQVIAAEE